MLRLIVLLLLLANGGFYAWSQGLLLPLGVGPVQQSEPQRMEQQIKPEAVRMVNADEARSLESAAPAPSACLQSPTLDDAAADGLRQALQSWPAGSWTLEGAVEPARWIIYMGKYAGAEQVARKKAELRQLRISFEALSNPALEPGLSLGGYNSQPAAVTQLERLADRGVRTARVVQERAEVRGQQLKLPAMDDALRARLDELRPALAGKALRTCR